MKEKKIGKKISIALLLLTVIIAGVLSHLQSKGNLTNQFDVGKVSAETEENFDGQVKSDVRVTKRIRECPYMSDVIFLLLYDRREKNKIRKQKTKTDNI